MAKIGVFDSGIGGLSVANAISANLPQHQVIFKNDSKNIPYGTKTNEQLIELVIPILQTMVSEGCDVIVIACNTVTTNLITELRELIAVPLIGIEPMIKPAAEQTKTGIIAVCATPATLRSKRYAYLKETYAKAITVLEPDCSDWSLMIEANQVDQSKIEAITKEIVAQNADVIVLGCTHYHWIEDIIKRFSEGKATVLQPEVPVLTQLKKILAN